MKNKKYRKALEGLHMVNLQHSYPYRMRLGEDNVDSLQSSYQYRLRLGLYGGLRTIVILIMMVSLVMEAAGVVFPRPLKKGDRIAIVAPAGPVKYENVEGAVNVLQAAGYEPVVYPSVHGSLGQFSGTPEERLKDMKDAFTDPEIRAVICARGGYGAVHLLDSLSALPLLDDPKWVVGFSDITAIHGLMASKGIASIHGPMALHISRGMDEPENAVFFDMLRGNYPEYTFPPNPLNHHGSAAGKLIGGNLSVIEGLVNTPYDMLQPGTILFIEDVAEEIYKLQRIMYRLKLAGVLDRLNGLIIGQFTEIPPGANYESVEPMMSEILEEYPDLPVAFDIPIGHIRNNAPVIESANATLEITPEGVRLDMRN